MIHTDQEVVREAVMVAQFRADTAPDFSLQVARFIFHLYSFLGRSFDDSEFRELGAEWVSNMDEVFDTILQMS